MRLFRALYAFYQSLFSRECEHSNIQPGKKYAPYCPDCGYKVDCLWMQVRCRGCESRLIPRKMPDGKIAPLLRHCKHCGASAYRVTKVAMITAHELYLSVAIKEIDYTEGRKSFISGEGRQGNPFKAANSPFDVVDGQILRSRYVGQKTDSAWGEAPFGWSKAQPQSQFLLPQKSSYRSKNPLV